MLINSESKDKQIVLFGLVVWEHNLIAYGSVEMRERVWANTKWQLNYKGWVPSNWYIIMITGDRHTIKRSGRQRAARQDLRASAKHKLKLKRVKQTAAGAGRKISKNKIYITRWNNQDSSVREMTDDNEHTSCLNILHSKVTWTLKAHHT